MGQSLCVVGTEGAGGDGGRLSVLVRGRSSQPTAVMTRRHGGVAGAAGPACDYDVTFTPTETGQHSITILLNDMPVTGTSPSSSLANR